MIENQKHTERQAIQTNRFNENPDYAAQIVGQNALMSNKVERYKQKVVNFKTADAGYVEDTTTLAVSDPRQLRFATEVINQGRGINTSNGFEFRAEAGIYKIKCYVDLEFYALTNYTELSNYLGGYLTDGTYYNIYTLSIYKNGTLVYPQSRVNMQLMDIAKSTTIYNFNGSQIFVKATVENTLQLADDDVITIKDNCIKYTGVAALTINTKGNIIINEIPEYQCQ